MKEEKTATEQREPQALLEETSSTNVNLLLTMMFIATVFLIIYNLTFLFYGIGFCQASISKFGDNVWFKIFYIGRPTIPSLPMVQMFLQLLLSVELKSENKKFLTSDSQGVTPWCSWCEQQDLVLLEQRFNDTFSEQLIENISAYNPYETIDFLLDTQNVSYSCIAMFQLNLQTAFRAGGNYGGNPFEEISKSLSNDTLLGCLKNESTRDICNPCGDANKMNVEIRELNHSDNNSSEFVIVDLLSNESFKLEEANRLASRCARRYYRMFLQPCLEDGQYYSLYSQTNTSEHSRDLRADVRVETEQENNFKLGLSVLDDKPTFSNFNIFPRRNLNNDRSRVKPLEKWFLSRIASVELSDANSGYQNSMIKTYQALGKKDSETRKVLIDVCGGGNPKGRGIKSIFDLIRQPVKDNWFSLKQSEKFFQDSYRSNAVLTCWTAYTLFFAHDQQCLNYTITESADESADKSAQLFLLLFLSTLIPNHLDYPNRYEQGYLSLDLFDLFAIGSISEDWYLYNLTTWKDESRPCLNNLKRAPDQLSQFLEFYDSGVSKCDVSATMLVYSALSGLVVFVCCLILMVMTLVSFVLDKASPYAPSVLALQLGVVCFTLFSFWSDASWKISDYKAYLFFDKKKAAHYYAISDALGLALFYLHHTWTRITALRLCASEKNHPGIKLFYSEITISGAIKSPVFHVFIAVLYFVVRGIICFFVFGVTPGMIPFVNLIIVGRICSDSYTTDFPYCSNSSEASFLPFIGNIVAVVSDLLLFIMAVIVSKKCKASMKNAEFSLFRGPHSVVLMKRIFFNMLLLPLLVIGIVYCAVINIHFFYSGVVQFTEEGAEYSGQDLKVTGVCLGRIGFILTVFIYALAWSILMLPPASRIGKFMARKFPINANGVKYYALEKEVPIDELHENTTFGKTTFVLEQHFLNWQFTHSVYDISKLDGKTLLPEGFDEICYIEEESTDTHVWLVASSDCIYVSFRGTKSTKNAKTDLTLSKTKLHWDISPESQIEEINAHEKLKDMVKTYPHIQVHKGFLLAFHTVQRQIALEIKRYQSINPSICKFVCTGHSLGGALANVCGAFIATGFHGSIVQVSTFGSPRVGNKHFQMYLEGVTSSCWRFVKRKDPIPKTPVHIQGYEHAGIQILLETDGDLIVDPNIVETFILHKCKAAGVAAHGKTAYLGSLLAFALKDREHQQKLAEMSLSTAANQKESFKPKLFPNCASMLVKSAPIYLREFPDAQKRIITFLEENNGKENTISENGNSDLDERLDFPLNYA